MNTPAEEAGGVAARDPGGKRGLQKRDQDPVLRQHAAEDRRPLALSRHGDRERHLELPERQHEEEVEGEKDEEEAVLK